MDGEGISDVLSAERKVVTRVNKNGRKVIVEKSAAEGLPEGWIKKLVISNRSGRKTRRDPFFIDPKSEYIFQSFKDASRYVETGVIGNYARKLKETDIEDDDSGHENNVILLESAEALLEKEKNIDIYVRNSKRRTNLSSSDEHSENGKMNSNLSSVTSQVLEDLGKKKDLLKKQPFAKRVTRSQAKETKTEEDVDVKRKNSSSSNAKSEEDNSVKSRLRSASSESPETKSVMEEEELRDSTENQITKSKTVVKKNELTNSVARRASKRLAGIELEPTPELNTRTKAQRVVLLTKEVADDEGTAGKCKQHVNPVATSGLKKMGIPLTKEVAKSYNTEYSSPKPNAAASTSMNRVSAELEMQIEKIGKSVGRNGSGDKKKLKMPLMTSEEGLNPVFHLDGYKQEEEMSPVSPLSHQTCATKREKTAAGKSLGRSSPKPNKVTRPKAMPLGSSNKGEHLHAYDSGNATQKRNKLSNESFETSVVRGTCSEVITMNNTNIISSSAAFDATLADLWKDPCIAFAIKTLTGDTLRLPNNTAAISPDPTNNHVKQKGVPFFPENVNTDSGKPVVCSELPGMDIWKDPCIDFAIKTLTGAIPIGLDELVVKPKSEGMTTTASSSRQEQEGRQSSSCNYLVQQCSNMKNKTMVKYGDLRFPQPFSKD